MVSLISVFLVAIIASDSLASAASNSFKLPLRRRDTGPRSLSRRSTGEVELTTASYNVNWDIDINIGGQKLTFGLDTGSTPLWVLSTRLSAANKTTLKSQGHDFFDPTLSTTFENISQGTFKIAYDKGQNYLAGDIGSDDVSISGLKANVPFGIATSVSEVILTDEVDGTFGMAFSAYSQLGRNAPTFVDAILDKLDEPVFTLYLPIGKNHSLEFGRVDKSLYQGELQTVAISNVTRGQPQSAGWHTYVSYSINGKNVSSQIQSTIFDTGGIEARANEDVVRAYWGLVKGAKDVSAQGNAIQWTFPCDSPLPDLTYNLNGPDGKPISATVPGRFFNLSALFPGRSYMSGNDCRGALNSNLNVAGTMGFPFWHTYFTVFNQSAPSVSIAQYPQKELEAIPQVAGNFSSVQPPAATASPHTGTIMSTGSAGSQSPKSTAAAQTTTSRGDAGVAMAPGDGFLAMLLSSLFMLGI